MTPTIMAFIMLASIIACIFYKKIPMQFVLAIVPIVCAMILGFNITEVSDMVINSINNTMRSVGYMLLFGLMYFTLLSETGMFEIVVKNIMKLTKGKINVYIVMILTTVVAAIGMLTASPVSAYLIVFPVMLSLYNKTKFDKKAAMIIAQTSIAAMSFLPWSTGIATSAVFAEVDPLELSKQVVPITLCFIPVIVGQWIFFAIRHKKQMSLLPIQESSKEEVAVEEGVSNNPNLRPHLFWVNFIIFILAVFALAYFKLPAYLVFIVTSFLTTMINYPNPRQHRPLWEKSGKTYYNTLVMLVGISVFVGVFNGTGMIDAISNVIVSIFPEFLARYMHIILLALCVVIIRFIPYQLYNSFYPLLISVGASFGLTGIVIIAPFVTNLAFGTGSSPMTPTTHVGISLLGIDMDEFCNLSVKVQTVSNIAVIIIGLLLGVIK